MRLDGRPLVETHQERAAGTVAGLVGIEGGVVSGVINIESPPSYEVCWAIGSGLSPEPGRHGTTEQTFGAKQQDPHTMQNRNKMFVESR